MSFNINWLAVLVATLAGMFIGFLWYGLFFQAQWSEAVGLTSEDQVNFFKRGVAVEMDPVTPMIINLLVLAALAVVLSWLTAKAGTGSYGAGAQVGLAVGFTVAAMSAIGNLFSMEPSMLSIIDGTYYLVVFAVMGAIVGGWKKTAVTT